MKLTKKLEKEVRQVYMEYWDCYMKGNSKKITEFLDNNVKIIGSTECEVYNNKREVTNFFISTADEVAGKMDFRNRNINLVPLDDFILINEQMDLYVLIDNEWAFYSKVRLSSLLQKKEKCWKFIHQHGSVPDSRTEEGESIAFETMTKENLELRDAVKRRTIELENKNRELEIETSLEKVRAVAMGMKQPADMLDVCRIISDQLQLLQVKEIRNLQTAIFYESKGIYLNYEYFTLFDHTVITEVEYNLQPDVKAFVNQMQHDPEAFFTTDFKGAKLKKWIEYQETANQFVDPHLSDVKSLHYYFYSIGPGALGISTYAPLNENELAVFKRFRNVFELAYRRFIDIQQAEAQAREAQIETALERTRTQSMLMQHSSELDITSRIFHEQLLLLGIQSEFSYVWLPDVEREKHLFWATWNEEQNGSNVLQSKSATYDLDRTEPYTAECFIAWGSGEPVHVYPVAATEVKNYFDIWSGIMGDAKKQKPEFYPEGLYYIEAFMKYGCFGINIRRLLTNDEKKILLRLTIEFERTYTRFLDLQKAEAQAREAQIENALEKVRSRTMAMQKSEELAETSFVLFQQFRGLGETSEQISIGIFKEGENIMELYSTLYGSPWKEPVRIDLDEPVVIKKIHAAWKEQKKSLVIDIAGKDLRKYNAYRKKLSNIEYKEERWVIHIAFFSKGVLTFSVTEPHPHETIQLLERFAQVFDQTYTRFLDLQKAEAQAREANIESALERVRSRSMAMHQSTELNDVANVLFEQLRQLGGNLLTCGIALCEENNTVDEFRMALGGGIARTIYIPNNEEPVHKSMYEGWKNKEELYIEARGGKELKAHYDYLMTLPSMESVLENLIASGLPFPNWQKWHAAYFSQGYLLIITLEHYADEQIFKRFAKVFDQAYTRYLDLQKAEAQAREAQINLAVERVRAKALAMYRSEEILEVVFKLKEEVMGLDIPGVAASTIFLKEANGHYRMWDLSSIELTEEKLHLPLDVSFRLEETDPGLYIRRIFSNTEHYFLVIQNEEDLQRTFQWLRDHGKKKEADEADQFVKTAQLKKLYHPSVQLTNGRMCIDLLEPPTAEIESILIKMGAAFDLAYKRFEDLRNSEEQLREAQIEAALERVRSKAMAMHKTDELLDAAELVQKELSALGISSMNVSYAFVDDEEKYGSYFSPNPVDGKIPPFPFVFPHTETEVMRSILSSWKKQEPFNVIELDEEATLKHQTYIGEYILQFFIDNSIDSPFSVEAFLAMSPKKAVLYTFNFTKGYLFHIGGQRLTAKHEELVMRFTKVFEQTYTRFLDLQKAEAQAREAQIEVALERVRSRAMAMQTSEELNALIGTVFTELTKLDIVLTRCVILIYEGKEKGVRWWMANSEAPVMPMNFLVKYADLPFFNSYIAGWNARTLKWQYILEGDNKILTDDFLFSETELSQLPDFVIAGMRAPEKVCLSSSFNNFGCLTLAGLEPLPDEHFDILLRFAKVFDLTYTRFNDLKQAEAQAREAQIELALERVRARTMAMQKSDELQVAAILLFQQMKALGVQTGSCGFNIWNKDEKAATVWMSSAEGGLQSPFKLPHTESAIYKQVYEAMKKGETFLVKEVGGKNLKKHFDYLLTLPGIGDVIKKLRETGYSFPETMVYHFAFFSQGYLSFHLHEHHPETHDIFKRFGKVFNQTYTRFLDLQKAEAQAKEAQIETALERVRSRTMGMQKSEELAEVIQIIFEELNKLGIDLMECSIATYDDTNPKDLIYWSAGPFGSAQSSSTKLQYIDHPLLIELLNDFENGVQYRSGEYSGELLKTWWDRIFVETDFKNAPIDFIESWKKIKQVFYSQAAMNHGFLEFLGATPLPDDKVQVLKRFTNVIDLTYTRYDDVVKAEAQARKAQIEAALERVRSRSMGMQKSEELKEVIQVVYEQFVHLNIHIEHTGFIMDYKARDDMHIWLADKHEVPSQVTIPYFDSAHWNSFIEAKEKGTDFFATHLTFEEKNRFYQMLFEYVPGISEEAMEFYFSCPGLAGSTVLLENVGLYIENFSGIPYSDEENNTLMRFGKVFQQTYTRFLDLQVKEDQSVKLKKEKEKLEKTLSELQATQKQLIQSEKMASLGELTAGIAHEIQNPLNFVNNFSEINNELIGEMKQELQDGNKEGAISIANDIEQNLEKINHHGKRADAIVKGMLQHSQKSSGQKEPTDINALCDEYLRLAFHGLRAKDKNFNSDFKTDFDESIGKINIVPQDIGRVLLNLYNNAFYAVNEKKKQKPDGYNPTISVSTKKTGDKVILTVEDNGNGIPQNFVDKIFQPFFTTKPTGQGTGLGLSLSYDIIKAHGGELKVESKEGEGTTFIIQLTA